MAELIILIRTNINWEQMTQEQFFQQDRQKNVSVPHQIKDLQTANILKIWNNAFGIDFFSFRKMMSDIATEQNKLVKNARIIVGFENIIELLEDDNEYYICPTDDDDWFHPDLYLASKQFEDPNIGLVQWKSAIAEKKYVYIRTDKHDINQTNQLMFSKKFLVKNLKTKDILELLCCHWQAGRIPKENCIKIDLNLSINNKHTASTVRVHYGKNNFDKVIAHLNELANLSTDKNIWFHEGIKKVAQAHIKLKESKKEIKKIII